MTTDYAKDYDNLLQALKDQKIAVDKTKADIEELKAQFLEQVLIPLCNKYAVAWVRGKLYPLRSGMGTDVVLDTSLGPIDPKRFGLSQATLNNLASPKTVFPTKLSLSNRVPSGPSLGINYSIDREPLPPEEER